MKKLMLVGAALAMAACAESSTDPSGSRRSVSGKRSADEFTCRSGYIIAYDEYGNPYCVPGDGFAPQDSSGMRMTPMMPTTQSPPRRP